MAETIRVRYVADTTIHMPISIAARTGISAVVTTAVAVREWAASPGSQRGEVMTLDEVCDRAGDDADTVRARARDRRLESMNNG